MWASDEDCRCRARNSQPSMTGIDRSSRMRLPAEMEAWAKAAELGSVAAAGLAGEADDAGAAREADLPADPGGLLVAGAGRHRPLLGPGPGPVADVHHEAVVRLVVHGGTLDGN